MATKHRKPRRHANPAQRPVVRVEEVDPVGKFDGEDWYTPKALRLKAQKLTASARFGTGNRDQGSAFCSIGEEEWERRFVRVELGINGAPTVPGTSVAVAWHSSTTTGHVGSFTPEALDALIDSMIRARDEAKRIGLLSPRPTPSSLKEILQLTSAVIKSNEDRTAQRPRASKSA